MSHILSINTTEHARSSFLLELQRISWGLPIMCPHSFPRSTYLIRTNTSREVLKFRRRLPVLPDEG